MAAPNVTALQKMTAQSMFAAIRAGPEREECIGLAAQALLEKAGKPVDANALAHLPNSVATVASFCPPDGSDAPADVKSIIAKAMSFYMHTPQGAAPAVQKFAAGGIIQVETADSKREAERWEVLRAFKLPRHPQGHFCALYANHWLKTRYTTSNEAMYDAWLRNSQEFLTLQACPPKFHARYQKLTESIHCWFLMLPPATDVPTDKVALPVIKLFQLLIEQFLELHLLATASLYRAGPEAVTKEFWTEVESWYHNTSTGFDYYKALTEAKAIKAPREETRQETTTRAAQQEKQTKRARK